MALNFTKLSAVATTDALKNSAYILLEEDGEIKRIQAATLGLGESEEEEIEDNHLVVNFIEGQSEFTTDEILEAEANNKIISGRLHLSEEAIFNLSYIGNMGGRLLFSTLPIYSLEEDAPELGAQLVVILDPDGNVNFAPIPVGVQISDWLAPMRESGYIANKPFELTAEPGEVIILPPTPMTFQGYGDAYLNNIELYLEHNKEYIITASMPDGTETMSWPVYAYDANRLDDLKASLIYDSYFEDSPYVFVLTDQMVNNYYNQNSCPFNFEYGYYNNGDTQGMVLHGKTNSTGQVLISISTNTNDYTVRMDPKYQQFFQADWEETNPSSNKFIKNKPYGKFIANNPTIIEERECNFYNGRCYFIDCNITPKIDTEKYYTVRWNGTNYYIRPNRVISDEEIYTFSRKSVTVADESPMGDFGEFLIFYAPKDGYNQIMIQLRDYEEYTAETHQLFIFDDTNNVEYYKKIKKEYLESNDSDWNARPGEEGYIKNKPVGFDYEDQNGVVLFERTFNKNNMSSNSACYYQTVAVEELLMSPDKCDFVIQFVDTNEERQYLGLKLRTLDSDSEYIGSTYDELNNNTIPPYPFSIQYDDNDYSTVTIYIDKDCFNNGDQVQMLLGYSIPSIITLDEQFISQDITRNYNKNLITDSKLIPEAINELHNRIYEVKNCILMKDTETGYDYALYLTNGVLVPQIMLARIEISQMPTKTDYTDTYVFDPAGMIVKSITQDGQEAEISDYEYDLQVSPGTANHEIRFVKDGVVYKAFVPITTKTLEEALIDYTYRVNDDGTYSITGWNETLNGEPSSQMELPNSDSVIL